MGINELKARKICTKKICIEVASATVVTIALYLSSVYSYILFHSLAELFSVIIAFSMFVMTWHTRKFTDSNYLLFIGIAYLFVGFTDLLHTLSYKGMAVFTGYGANLPTQLWISARYTESISLLAALFFIDRKPHLVQQLAIYSAMTLFVLFMIFGGFFPVCYVEGTGITVFKRISEYAICLILIFSLILLFRNRNKFDCNVFTLIAFSIVAGILQELCFTLYFSVYDFWNWAGHFLKIISFYLMYRAIIKTGLEKPSTMIFRELKNREEDLVRERDELKKALSEIKTLRGLLPICSACKKIRDDNGYWNQVEVYIKERSEADFTHSLCPDCIAKLYPWYQESQEKESGQ